MSITLEEVQMRKRNKAKIVLKVSKDTAKWIRQHRISPELLFEKAVKEVLESEDNPTITFEPAKKHIEKDILNTEDVKITDKDIRDNLEKIRRNEPLTVPLAILRKHKFQKKYYSSNMTEADRSHMREYQKRYYQEHPEKNTKYQKRYRKTHPELKQKMIKAHRKYYLKHKVKYKQYARKYYQKNKVKQIAYAKNYYRKQKARMQREARQ